MSQIIRKGVKSLSKSGSAKLTDDVTLSEGSNITLTQTGNDIEIAAAGGGGSGDVVGPASSTDNAIARFDSTTGKLIQNSNVIIDDTTGSITFNGTSPSINSASGVFALNTGTTQINASSGGVSLTGNMGIFMNGPTYADTLDEVTTGVGVTIDGVLLKDGEVDGRDVAADGSKLDGIESGADVTDSTNVQAALPSGSNGQVLKHNGTSWAAGTDNNTTYSEISEANIENTASSTVGLITGRRAEALLDNEASKARTLSNKTLTSPVLNTGVSGTAIKDEDDMASNSATHLATQQSIKAYVDTSIAPMPMIAELARHDVSGTEATIDITGLSQDYEDLLLVIRLITNRSTTSSLDRLQLQFGDSSIDTGSNYSWNVLLTELTVPTVSAEQSTSDTLIRAGSMLATNSHNNEFSTFGRIIIQDYTNSAEWKQVRSSGGSSWTSASGQYQSQGMGVWRNKADPVSKIRLTAVGGSFVEGYVKVIGMNPGCAYV